MSDNTILIKNAFILSPNENFKGKKSDKEIYLLEDANVKKYEMPIAKELEEPVRKEYGYASGFKGMNNSIHHIHKRIASWLVIWMHSAEIHDNRYPSISGNKKFSQ